MLATGAPPITSITMNLGDYPLTGHGLSVDGVQVGVAPRRAALDQVLIDAAIEAGAELRERFSVEALTFADGRVTGVRSRGGATESARFVIGADGRNSSVANDHPVFAPVHLEALTRDAQLLAAALTDTLSGACSEEAALSGYESRRNEATMDDYEANIRAALFTPLAPQILEARAAARDDPQAMAQFCLAWEGRVSQRPPAAGLYKAPSSN